jgi:hypothetical protein
VKKRYSWVAFCEVISKIYYQEVLFGFVLLYVTQLQVHVQDRLTILNPSCHVMHPSGKWCALLVPLWRSCFMLVLPDGKRKQANILHVARWYKPVYPNEFGVCPIGAASASLVARN